MSRYRKLFEQRSRAGQIAYIPFVVLGDPDPELSLALIDMLVASGADALELGIPFSDPVADGPVIQRAAGRALLAGTSQDRAFDLLAEIRRRHPSIALGLLVYANLVYHRGVDAFYRRCAGVEVDSVLVADVPVREVGRFASEAQRQKIAQILIVPPDTGAERLEEIVAAGSGYTYLLARTGVTGISSAKSTGVPDPGIVRHLRACQAAPLVQGFGVSTPEQVLAARDAGMDGVITGSAIAELIDRNLQQPERLLHVVGEYVTMMAAAAHQDRMPGSGRVAKAAVP